MQSNELEDKKAAAFTDICDILFNLPTEEGKEIEKADHMLDILEQITARVIAASCLEASHVEEMSQQCAENIEEMAKAYLAEEQAEPTGDDK